MTKPTRLPSRSKRFGVGKDIGGAVYVHRLYEEVLGDSLTRAKDLLPSDFDYQIVKYNYRTEAVSFIHSPDFDTASEPTVGEMAIVNTQGNIRRRKQATDPEIYHHKWLFVEDDYPEFSTDQSKIRSLQWLSLENVDRHRIGKKSYWETKVIPRLS